MQEGLGGIRDVLLNSLHEVYCNIYRKADINLRRAQARTIFISQSPRYLMEALGMLLIVALAFFLADKPSGVSEAIPKLGALALGAQRLLPALQNIYWAITTIKSSESSLIDVLNLLDQPLPEFAKDEDGENIIFLNQIVLENVSFRYASDSPWILQGVNLKINKGDNIGFIGLTGSGKSTLIDLIMGLLEPTSGTISVDGVKLSARNYRSWQKNITHVPQSIFLADSSVKMNIAFGIPAQEIEDQRLEAASEQAQISEAIKSWPDGYETYVGERGVKLSGGQRQRIGIARALYKRADIIVFDEATSALDTETENEVMNAIYDFSGKLTMLIIAHRLTTLKNCNLIVELSEGKILRVGTYEEVIQLRQSFIK
jgi:ATP-binding cassette subfamily B protein